MLQPRAVVIGTGFGGAVASCRLAQAGFEVTVLERGRRYDGEVPGFPRGKPLEWLWDPSRSLFDVRALSEIQVVQAAGYGGGSLIYANVHLRAPAEVFNASWPEGYSREALDPHYDLVAYMLDIQPIDRSPYGVPPRAEQLRRVTEALGRADQFIHPPLAINFATEPGPNKFGVNQGTCTHCGECVIGCVNRAKNTLDFNYLAVAERLGARMLTECEVLQIEPRGGGAAGYRVRYRDHQRGSDETEEAAHVFICAGAINSTELLLRSRASGALPRINGRLGTRYSGNGDLLAFAFDTDPAVQPDNGPTITTALLYSGAAAAGGDWFLIEDGGFPRVLWPLVARVRPLPVGLTAPEDVAPPRLHSEVSAMLREQAEATMPVPGTGGQPDAEPTGQLVDDSAMARTGAFLGMGRDLANGRIELLDGRVLCLKWDVPSNLGLYSLEERLTRDLAGGLKGTYKANPFWRFLRQPLTVHNLGGCPMGRSEADGVVDAQGEVFNYPGLFVMDGAVLPGATGVNPAHTIAAVAERNIEHFIRKTLGNPGWTAPERRAMKPFADPLTPVPIPSAGTRPPDASAVGLTFREKMSGWWEATGTAPQRRDAHCNLRITLDDVDRFIADPAHVGIVTGSITVVGLTDPGGVEVQNGVWNLFVESGRPEEREMRYSLPFHGEDGVLYVLRGTKVFRPRPGLRLWAENTTLDFQIGIEAADRAPAVGVGVLTIGVFRVLALAASMRVLRAPNLGVARRALLDFFGFYAASLKRVSHGE
jgi:cholesterol oxidase